MAGKKILIVDDDPLNRNLLKEVFIRKGHEMELAENGKVAIQLLQNHAFDLLFTDMKMPEKTGLDVLHFVKEHHPQTIVIIMTAYGTVENAVEAMKKGAFHYLIKPFSLEALEAIFERAEQHLSLVKENQYLREEISSSLPIPLITESRSMKKILHDLEKIAPTNATVFISGESGTGKEVIAQKIYQSSLRAHKPFIKVNCAAIPDTLIESEFFGHEKGSFTGALSRKEGRFERANGGTLLLDEVTEIPLLLQPKLLRAIQEQEIERIGSTKPIPVNIRFLATSNREMEAAIQKKEFREDLYFRLNVVPIYIPPLRERLEDILPLARYFLHFFCKENHKELKKLSQSAQETLQKYPWPGNVRELANLMERIVVLESTTTIERGQLHLEERNALEHPNKPALGTTLQEIEKHYILEALKEKNYHREQTAKALGISVRTLRNKLHQFEKGSDLCENSSKAKRC